MPARRPFHFYFAIALRRARTDAEMTQEELADRVGMEPSEISALESGRRSPQIDTAKRLTDGLGVSFSQVTGLAEEFEAGTHWDDIRWPPSG
jgi:transcriptional regulator with XRE-family HTH domain